jgi:hypothetical protein
MIHGCDLQLILYALRFMKYDLRSMFKIEDYFWLLIGDSSSTIYDLWAMV